MAISCFIYSNKAAGAWSWRHPHLARRFRKRGAVPLLLHVPSCCGA